MRNLKCRKKTDIFVIIRKLPLVKFRKFVLSNFTGTLVDTFFLWLFSNYFFSSYTGKYIAAPAISFEIAMFKNYMTSYFWIWKERVELKKGDFFKRLLYYNLNSALAFLVKLGLIIFIERLTHLHVVFCNLIALIFSGLINYYIQDKMIFRRMPAED